jgi:hypothetical protein
MVSFIDLDLVCVERRGKRRIEMSKKLIFGNDKKIVEEPTWEDVYKELNRLGEPGYSFLYLETKGIGSLTAGGGNYIEEKEEKLYHVSFFDLDADSTILLNPEGDPDEIHSLIIDDRLGDFFEEHLVGLPAVIKAFEHFYKTGKLTDQLKWE